MARGTWLAWVISDADLEHPGPLAARAHTADHKNSTSPRPMMPRHRNQAPPGSFTPRIRIYETVDLIRVDQEYQIPCPDPSDVQIGDEIAFLRPEFTPFARSTYVKDDLVEAKVTQIARGVAVLDYRFLNGEAVKPQGDEKWKGMRPATLAKVWCKRRRRPQEDRNEVLLDPENLPFIVERINAPLPPPEPKHAVPDVLAHVIEDAWQILATTGPEGDLPVDVLRDMLAALGPASPQADLSGGHARRLGLSLMLVRRSCEAMGRDAPVGTLIRRLGLAFGFKPPGDTADELARLARVRRLSPEAGMAGLDAVIELGLAEAQELSDGGGNGVFRHARDGVRQPVALAYGAGLRAFARDPSCERESTIAAAVILHTLAAEMASRPDNPFFARTRFWSWLLDIGLPSAAQCVGVVHQEE